MTQIKKEGHMTTVPHEFVQQMDLLITEYCMLDLIQSLEDPETGWCSVSKSVLASTLGFEKPSVFQMLLRLEKKGVVERHKETKFLRTTARFKQEQSLFEEESNKKIYSQIGRKVDRRTKFTFRIPKAPIEWDSRFSSANS